jgi:hypothetical protein
MRIIFSHSKRTEGTRTESNDNTSSQWTIWHIISWSVQTRWYGWRTDMMSAVRNDFRLACCAWCECTLSDTEQGTHFHIHWRRDISIDINTYLSVFHTGRYTIEVWLPCPSSPYTSRVTLSEGQGAEFTHFEIYESISARFICLSPI